LTPLVRVDFQTSDFLKTRIDTTALSRLTNHGEFYVKHADDAQPCAPAANGNVLAHLTSILMRLRPSGFPATRRSRQTPRPPDRQFRPLKRASSSSPASIASARAAHSKAALTGRFPGLSEIKISPSFGPQGRIRVGNLKRHLYCGKPFNADERSFQRGP
jgi:hypothetical protein